VAADSIRTFAPPGFSQLPLQILHPAGPPSFGRLRRPMLIVERWLGAQLFAKRQELIPRTDFVKVVAICKR
jgi:hypothetical protein